MKRFKLWLAGLFFVTLFHLAQVTCASLPAGQAAAKVPRTDKNVLPGIQADHIALADNGSSLVAIGKKISWLSTYSRQTRHEFSCTPHETLRFLNLSGDGNSVLLLRGMLRHRPRLELWQYSNDHTRCLWSLDKKFAYKIDKTNRSLIYDRVAAAVLLPDKILVGAFSFIITLNYQGAEIKKRIPAQGLDTPFSPADYAAFSSDGKYVFACNSMYDARTGKVLWTLWEEQFVDHVRFSPSGHWICIDAVDPANNEQDMLLETRSGKESSTPEDSIVGFFAPHDSIAVLSEPLRFINPHTKKPATFRHLKTFADPDKDILKDLQISHDGKVIAALSHSKKVSLQIS
jgi:hypothetical protein